MPDILVLILATLIGILAVVFIVVGLVKSLRKTLAFLLLGIPGSVLCVAVFLLFFGVFLLGIAIVAVITVISIIFGIIGMFFKGMDALRAAANTIGGSARGLGAFCRFLNTKLGGFALVAGAVWVWTGKLLKQILIDSKSFYKQFSPFVEAEKL